MKKVTIDARMINNSGIGVYICNYVNCLLNVSDIEVILLGDKKVLFHKFGSNKGVTILNFTKPIYSIWEQFFFPFVIPNCDVFWSPHYNIPLLPIKAKKRVVTIPDAAHLALSKTFEFGLVKKLYSNLVFRAAAHMSDKVITISNFSKKEIIKYTGIKNSKIQTVHLGINRELFKEISKLELGDTRVKYNLPENFILFVGNVKPHKNLIMLLESFIIASQQLRSVGLVILGKKEGFITGDNRVFEKINGNSYLSQNVHFTGYVPESDLPKIYNLASLFVFPSLYEGFGFPPLEAMACGVPVVSSNAASLPEICGDSVEYFDPNDSEQMAAKILDVFNDVNLREKLIIKGLKRSTDYTWELSSQKFLNNLL